MKLFVIYCFVMTFFVVLPLFSNVVETEVSKSNQITAGHFENAGNHHGNMSASCLEKLVLDGLREIENSGKK